MRVPLMFIGEAAREADTTIKTIGCHERIGLLPPAPRKDGRFRVYDEDTVERVRFIRKAQALGFSLDEIREIVQVYDQGQCSCGQVRVSIEAKLRIIEGKQDELEVLKQQLLSTHDRLPATSARRSSRLCPVIHAS